MCVSVSRGLLGISAVKNPAVSVGDVGLILGLCRSPGEGNGNLLQYSGLCHGILQARILEWLAMLSSRGSSFPKPGERTSLESPALAGWFFTTCLGLPCGSTGKETACNVGGLGLIPGLGSSPREGNGYPLQYSGLEKSMDCIVHGVAKI